MSSFFDERWPLTASLAIPSTRDQAISAKGNGSTWAHLTKRKIKHGKGSVILVNDEGSATLSDKAERPEKKR